MFQLTGDPDSLQVHIKILGDSWYANRYLILRTEHVVLRYLATYSTLQLEEDNGFGWLELG